MKTIVRFLSFAARRAPWVVIGVAVLVTLGLGSLAGRFEPAEGGGEEFAPQAPEIVAQERIRELFGDGTSREVLQVLVAADDGDVLDLDGLAVVEAATRTVFESELAPYLVDDENEPPVVHFLLPVVEALRRGAPPPTTDAEVKALFRAALDRMPRQQAALLVGLLPEQADLEAATSPSGLLLVFTRPPADPAGEEGYRTALAATAERLRTVSAPEGMSVEPFAFELLFAEGGGEFQREIGRLFATAAFIILLVLSIVFLVRPRSGRDRLLAGAGAAAMALAVVVLVLPGIAAIFPDLLPESVAAWQTGTVLRAAAGVYAVVYLVWTFGSRGLRRTTADTLVTIVTIVMAISWMFGYGALRFGRQNDMVQILPILLIGLGVDYAIHVNSRYREEVHGGASVTAAIDAAIHTVGVALVLATVTTAVGFLTNLVNDLPALREFGELAAVGIGASFLLMLTFVPAVRGLLDRRAERRGALDRERLAGGEARRLSRTVGAAAALPTHFAVGTIVVSLLLGVLGAYGTSKVEARFSFLDFIPTTSPLRQTFETLLDDYRGGFGERTDVLVEGDVATGAAWNAMAEAWENMADSPGVVVVGDVAAARSPISEIVERVDPARDGFVPELAAVAGEVGLGSDLRVPEGASVTPLYDALFEVAPDAAVGVLHRGDGGYDAARFVVTTNAGEEGAAELAAALRADFAPVVAAGLSAQATSQEIISDVVIRSLQDSQVTSLLLTILAALALLVVNFTYESRRPMLGVLTTLPVGLVVLWSFAVMALVGIPFGPVTATISALAVGIGIPYMIHVTHRYLEDRVRRPTAEEAIRETLLHAGGALTGSALTTIAGFGVLVISSTIPFRQFGFVTAYTIFLAVVGAVLVLPAYLVVWDRWHRARGEDPVDAAAVARALEEDLT
ncbi:MAG TPA: hypothetical protein ENK55_04955 [Actinobacteria bacterium]|nr:hypothetical protein [Actinomycetota bacterium]